MVDIAPNDGDWEGAVAALRKAGFARWIRNVPGHGYVGDGAHIHAVLMGNKELSPLRGSRSTATCAATTAWRVARRTTVPASS